MIAVPEIEALLSEVREALDRGRSVIRPLPFGGRIRIEKPHPFLFVCRVGGPDHDGTEALVTGHPSYAVLPDDERFDEVARSLVTEVAAALGRRCGAVCVLEMAFSALDGGDGTDERHTSAPLFRAWLDPDPRWAGLSDDLVLALDSVSVEGHPGHLVRVDRARTRSLPGRTALLGPAELVGARDCWIGIEAQPVYRDVRTGRPYPPVLEGLHREMTRVMRNVLSAFTRRHAGWTPPSPAVLGRRLVDDPTRRTDDTLVDIGGSFDFLLQLTPGNLEACWEELCASGFEREPRFDYRPLPIDPGILKRRVFEAPVEKIEDPTLAVLYREKQEELDRVLSMLRDRGEDFLYESLQLYGCPDERLVGLAELLLAETPPDDPAGDATLALESFLRRARAEVTAYRAQSDRFPADIEVRDDVAAGLMVSNGRVLIHPEVRIPSQRADALLEHEIGTHVVTWFNGMEQELRLFGHGLARYEATQEGLAVLAEWLTGGLTTTRLRILGARVLTARDVADGATFVDAFRRLTRECGLPQRIAFQTAVRALRGGGLTKDMAYLHGLVGVLGYLRDGGDILPLYAGKLALHHLPEIDELQRREILKPPTVRPRVIDRMDAQARLDRVRAGGPIEELLRHMAHETAGTAERIGG